MLSDTRAVDLADCSVGAEYRRTLHDLPGVMVTMTMYSCGRADALIDQRYLEVVRPAILSELERVEWAQEATSGERLKGGAG